MQIFKKKRMRAKPKQKVNVPMDYLCLNNFFASLHQKIYFHLTTQRTITRKQRDSQILIQANTQASESGGSVLHILFGQDMHNISIPNVGRMLQQVKHINPSPFNLLPTCMLMRCGHLSTIVSHYRYLSIFVYISIKYTCMQDI